MTNLDLGNYYLKRMSDLVTKIFASKNILNSPAGDNNSLQLVNNINHNVNKYLSIQAKYNQLFNSCDRLTHNTLFKNKYNYFFKDSNYGEFDKIYSSEATKEILINRKYIPGVYNLAK